jgi:regulatory protein
MVEDAKQQPSRPDAASLYAAALRYLARYAASERRLRERLRQKAMQGARAHAVPAAEVEAMIETAVERLRQLGYLDDVRFASGRARSLAERGRSTLAIRAGLAAAGIERDDVEQALTTLRRDEPELSAAVALARRRRLGPWRLEEERGPNLLRDLAVLTRAGFPLSMARTVVEAESEAALKTLLADLTES